MTPKETLQAVSALQDAIFSGQLREALETAARLARLVSRDDYFYRLESLAENYKTLLQYAWQGYEDPQRRHILNGISASLLLLADDLKQDLNDQSFPARAAERRALAAEFGDDAAVIAAKVGEIFFQREIDRLLETGNQVPIHVMDRVFRLIWFTGILSPAHQELIRSIGQDSQVLWHEKCLVVSALTMSLLNRFDPGKMILLLEAAESGEDQVSQRALVGVVLGILAYDRRIPLHSELEARIRLASSDESFRSAMEIILMQLLRARETEKITREFEEEVLPEMKKMMPKIEDKLQLTDPSEDEDMEGKNPGWKDIMDEVPGLFEKIEKFSRMQMEGGDVFMSTFSMLKRFDFFNLASNWFAPFHRDHPEISEGIEGLGESGNRLVESLEKAFYICNSDKYSFAINFRHIPEQQRTMIITHFEAEFAQISELASEEQVLDRSLLTNSVYIQYIQDLYRFFKLYPGRQATEDVFRRRIRLHSLPFFRSHLLRKAFQEKVAAFHFDNDHYEEAIGEYNALMEVRGPGREDFEKIGYCHQKAGRYREAVDHYRKAELFDNDHLWLLKKIGWCSLKLGEYRQALDCFREASALQPDDRTLQIQAGQCCLHLKDYEQALQVFIPLRYFDPENLRILRPIAYCHFVLGRPGQAAEVNAEILSVASPPTAFDLMNAANALLCLGRRDEALSLYRQALSMEKPGRAGLLEAFTEDEPYLVKNGIREEELPLIRDFLVYQAEN